MYGTPKLSEYLAQLWGDLDLLAEYRRDRAQALEASGLMPDYRDALMRGNLDEIRGLLEQESGDDESFFELCIIIGWP